MRRLLPQLALAVAMLACGTVSATAQPAPYTIDVILSLTGPGAFVGKTQLESLKLYEPIVNRQGGIHGQPVHFEVHDDQGVPAVTVQLASAILAKHPAVVLGGSLAQACSAMAPLFANGPVLFALSPGFYPTPHSFVFASIYTSNYGIGGQLRFLADRGLTRLAYIASTDTSGQGNEFGMQSALKEPEFRNLHIVAAEHFTPSDLSVAAQMARIKAANPQALMVWASGTPFGTVLRGVADAGLDVPVGTTAANMLADQLAGYASVLPKELYFSGQSMLNVDRRSGDPLKEPIDEFAGAYANAGIKPTIVSGLAWDPALIVVSALRRLPPNATGAQLHTYLERLHDFPGTGGMYDFRTGDQHGLTQSAVIVVRWDAPHSTYVVVSQQGGAPLPGR
jgi:branched-chain amino acid transport system substrate-binding protein